MLIAERDVPVLTTRVMASDDPTRPLADGLHTPQPGRQTSAMRTKDVLLDGGDEPAVVTRTGERQWLREGVLHREGNPAVVSASGGEEWWRRGVFHRDSGPAVTTGGGDAEYWFDGKRTVDPFEENWTRIGLALAHAAFCPGHAQRLEAGRRPRPIRTMC
jgi:hypothetical protein